MLPASIITVLAPQFEGSDAVVLKPGMKLEDRREPGDGSLQVTYLEMNVVQGHLPHI